MGNKKGKRTANHSGSIRKKIEKKDGKKYVSWRARYSLPDGTQREKKFPSAEEARTFLNQTLADIQNDDYLEPSLITVGQWLDIYLDEYTANLKPLTKKSYIAQINTHVTKKKPSLATSLMAIMCGIGYTESFASFMTSIFGLLAYVESVLAVPNAIAASDKNCFPQKDSLHWDYGNMCS